MNYGNWATDAAGRITFTPYAQPQQSGTKAELYSYNADGYLVSVREASSGYDYLTGLITPPDLANAFTRALTSYDAMGRVTGYVEYNISGQAQFERYGIVHDLRGAVIAERGRTLLAKSSGTGFELRGHNTNYGA